MEDHNTGGPAPGEPDWQRPPRTPGELHAWLRHVLGLDFPRTARVEGHAPAFAYLCWAFFEGLPALPDQPRTPDQPPAQDEAPADAVVWACRGGGKTLAGAVATALDLVFKPGIEVRILAGSLEQAQRMHRHLRDLFERPALAPLIRGRITDRVLALTNGSRAEVLAQAQTSIRGVRVQKLRCDEVELFGRDVWEAAQLTTRSRTLGRFHIRGSVECLSTMHEPHGIMAEVTAQAAAGSRALFRWGVVDVLAPCEGWRDCRAKPEAGESGALRPGAIVSLPILDRATAPRATAPRATASPPSSAASRAAPPPRPDCPLLPECAGRAKTIFSPGHFDIADAITMKSRVGRHAWEAEMLCLRPRREHTVFPEFDPALHVVDRAPLEASPEARRGLIRLATIDFGFRVPTVILWGALDREGRLWITDERSVAECVMREHIEALADPARPRAAWVAIDPAGRQRSDQTGVSSAHLLREAGFVVRAAPSAIETGIALIRARLRPALAEATPRLFIHRRCATLIESMERHHYPQARPEATEPVKDGTDHAVDALRYLVVNLDRPQKAEVKRYA